MFQQSLAGRRSQFATALLVALFATAMLVVTAPSLSAAPTATLTGSVADDLGVPLEDICVTASDGYSTMTDPSGDYSMLVSGDQLLTVQFEDCAATPTHLAEWYSDAREEQYATPVEVATGEIRDLGTIDLARQATISGTVTDSDGNGIAGLCVDAEDTGRQWTGGTDTLADGTYLIDRLPSGDLTVSFGSCGGVDYAEQWYDGVSDHDDAQVLTVGTGDSLTGIDAQMQSAGSITGRVTDSFGSGLDDICVFAFQGSEGTAGAQSEADGSYVLEGLAPGDHKVGFEACDSGHAVLGEFYDDVRSPADAEPVAVVGATTVTGIDASLAPAAQIVGTVTDTGGSPIEGACVQVSGNDHLDDTVTTESDGSYALFVEPGTHFVQFIACSTDSPFTGRWWGGGATRDSAQPLQLSVGAATDASTTLSAGTLGSISGAITDVSGSPGADLCVAVYMGGDGVMFTQADSDGRYRVDDVASGEWFVAFLGCDEDSQDIAEINGIAYWSQWSNGQRLVIVDDQGPDPVAAGANLNRIVGSQTTTTDACFGCGLVKITGTERNGDSITVSFTEPDLPDTSSGLGSAAVDWSYSVTCRPASGSLGSRSATGSGSPLTVTGLDPATAYGCALAVVVRGVVVANSTETEVLAATSTAPSEAGNSTGAGSSDQSGVTDSTAPTAGATGTAAAQPTPAKLAFTGARSSLLSALALVLVALGLAMSAWAASMRRRHRTT